MSRENRLSAMAAQKNAERGKPILAMHIWTVSKERKIESRCCIVSGKPSAPLQPNPLMLYIPLPRKAITTRSGQVGGY